MNNKPTSSNYVIAVDLGGTKTAVGIVSPKGEILDRITEPTCQLGGITGVMQIVDLSKRLMAGFGLEAAQVAGIGIGLPAVLEKDTDYVIWGPNLNGWKDIHAAEIIKNEVNLPVFLEYDGHTAALGEWWQGAGQGSQNMIDVIIGTGVGGGIVLNGSLVRGQNRLAGAVGWFVMDTNVREIANEGRRLGHWESLVAGPGILKRAKEKLTEYPNSVLNTCANLSTKDIFAYADQDVLANQIVNETGRLIGLGLSNLVSVLNPEKIVLGGSIGQYQGKKLVPAIKETISQWAQPYSAQSVQIIPSRLGADAGLYGAAYSAYIRAGVSMQI